MRFFSRRARLEEIEPDEILIDAANLPAFDTSRLEGRIERPVAPRTFRFFFVLFCLFTLIAFLQLTNLQIFQYQALSARAEENRLTHSTVLAERGLLIDRNNEPLAKNEEGNDGEFSIRSYPLGEAAAQLVGYVSYPRKDENGYWYQDYIDGVEGAELLFQDRISGKNGLDIAETNASGSTVSGSIVRGALSGANVALSIDAELQKNLYETIKTRSIESKWSGGAGAIMDIKTGELYALASYPSFDPSVMSSGAPKEAVSAVLTDPRAPLLNRVLSGLYTPGSVVKPFVATIALENHVITPEKQILSTGSISVPNPYNPSKPSVFKDWKAHGWVDMRHALAVSSDVYFYEVGGGFQDQPGLGIAAIERGLRSFGIGELTGIALPGEVPGTIPNPEWKAENFDGERWLLGDTYITSIGQYGFQMTLLQLLRGVSSIASGGNLVTPQIEAGKTGTTKRVPVDDASLSVVRDGMRLAVTEGTAQALSVYGIKVSGKTGTAEIGARKEFTNSLVIGFFPSDHPKYAFAVVMERGKAGTLQGAPSVMHSVLEWIVAYRSVMAKDDQLPE